MLAQQSSTAWAVVSLTSVARKLTLNMSGSSSKLTLSALNLCLNPCGRHDGGIVAAKYDQPGYVHAMQMVRKETL